jgi:peptide/nickel transport system ATP-binding protein
MSAYVLEVDDLHVTLPSAAGDVRALRGASLAVKPGEIVGLVGESGSGKTMLGLASLGLLPREPAPRVSGRALLDGINMVTAPEAERRQRRGLRIGAVFQDPMTSLNPTMRVGRQVAEAAGGADASVVCDLLAETGIPEPDVKARCYPHQLSGGLRQRVMIAMALARKPSLIVADEPTTALDVTVQARVLELLADAVTGHGVALLLVTHDLGVAARICDRIAVAYAGRIVETGPTAELLAAPRHPYTLGLLASRPRIDGAVGGGDLPTLPGRPPDPRRPDAGCSFRARCPRADGRCAQTPPTHIDGARSDECHHPRELIAWPAGDQTRPVRFAGVHDVGDQAQAALVVRDLTVEFERPRTRALSARPEPLRAVDRASLEIPAGGAVAIVGESGSGKTTLLRAVVGLQQPTAGTIETGPGAAPQMVFQDAGSSLTPWMPVGTQISERLAACGVPKSERPERVAATLDAVGLPHEAAAMIPRKLSGGQRQRAALARAIAVPPALLACDEPVSALDVSLAAQVLNLLCDLRRQLGIALLFVTHDLAAARAVAEEVVVMRAGVIVERGATSALFERPQHEYTRELLAAVPEVDPRVEVAA